MENCKVCKYKSVDTIDSGFLCKIHGPMYHISICKEFEIDVTKLKAKKCNQCLFFKVSESIDTCTNPDEKDLLMGTCMKYLLREYDGYTRRSCSQFVEKTQNNIT